MRQGLFDWHFLYVVPLIVVIGAAPARFGSIVGVLYESLLDESADIIDSGGLSEGLVLARNEVEFLVSAG